jgi:hypothetical protein
VNRSIAALALLVGAILVPALGAEPQTAIPPVAAPAAAGAPGAAESAAPEPAVQTSSAAAAPSTPRPAPLPRKGAAGAHAQDRIELEATQITGNRELPNVMYVVPWKKPDLGDFAGRPPKSLLDEMLAPLDREVFQRQNRYFAALQPDAAASGGAARPPEARAPAPAAPVSGDEK